MYLQHEEGVRWRPDLEPDTGLHHPPLPLVRPAPLEEVVLLEERVKKVLWRFVHLYTAHLHVVLSRVEVTELTPRPAGTFTLQEVLADGNTAVHGGEICGYAFSNRLISY